MERNRSTEELNLDMLESPLRIQDNRHTKLSLSSFDLNNGHTIGFHPFAA